MEVPLAEAVAVAVEEAGRAEGNFFSQVDFWVKYTYQHSKATTNDVRDARRRVLPTVFNGVWFRQHMLY